MAAESDPGVTPPAAKPGLQDLLSRAMARQTPKATRRKPNDSITPKELAEAERRIKARFNDPANWVQQRTVALIHEESDTLLGNYAEYRHKLAHGICRKLVRVNGPAKVDDVEYVKGQNWLELELFKPSDDPEILAEEIREAILDLHMPELDNVFAPACMVIVTLQFGSVARVELESETRFYSKDKRVQLILPAGLDVREGLSLETRVRLKEFLGI